MGLTHRSTGMHAAEPSHSPHSHSHPHETVIALAGNPNVGKSTLFNALTGMNQHTGNWAGKTVTLAEGYCDNSDVSFCLVDLPGTYSLMAHSAEEEVARNFLCFHAPDAVCVVCDATCLERNLNLVLQTLEITPRVAVCINMMDEAERNGIKIDLPVLQKRLGVPVLGCSAKNRSTLQQLFPVWESLTNRHYQASPYMVQYPEAIEQALVPVHQALHTKDCRGLNRRWLSLRLLEDDSEFLSALDEFLGSDFRRDAALFSALQKAAAILHQAGILREELKDAIVTALLASAAALSDEAVQHNTTAQQTRTKRLDRILTSRKTGYPIMLMLLALIFWITIVGANYPSQLLSELFLWLERHLSAALLNLGAPIWLHDALVCGVWRVMTWVVAVMLPPMAIFFPLFTVLEDIGYLPRIAYNLDLPFKRCGACGKQALTMCMGFGCNAAGVVGCRIIDSPRERLLAILTNAFVPCNGRFPILVNLILLFFVGTSGGAKESVLSAVLLTAFILLGIVMTLAVTKLLSRTLLRGLPSAFILEMPPFRRPQIGQVLIRSVLDRTLFVLGRAIMVSAPAGLLLWLMANCHIEGITLLARCAAFLEPLGQLMGLDGIILIAFILGFPASEIVMPIILMAYLAEGQLQDGISLMAMRDLLTANGWTPVTALCTMIFTLMHWPCSTTLLTIKKETASWHYTLLAAVIPTVIGFLLCSIVSSVGNLFL